VPGPANEPAKKLMKVAIFDDSPEVLLLYRDLLSIITVDVLDLPPVTSVEQVMELFRRERPDIVITDLCLTSGGREGYDVLAKIKRESPNTPVALSTSTYSKTSLDPECVKMREKGYDALFNKVDLQGITEYIMKMKFNF
jgi:DNA-binding NtrC family response regulator